MQSNQTTNVTMRDYIDIFLRRWRLVLLVFTATAAISMIIGFRLPKMYRSSTLILIEKQQIPLEYIRPTIGVEIGERLQTITQHITSRSLLEKAINMLNLYGESKAPMDSKIAMMRSNVEINVRGRDSFTISFKGKDPEMVMKVTNMLSSLFIEENLKIREQQVVGTSEFLENELKLIKGKLESKEKALKEYKTQFIGELPEQVQSNLAALNRFELGLQTTTEALRAAEDRMVILQKQIEERKGELERQVGTNPLQNRLDTLRSQLADLQSRYSDKYPDIPRLKREIKETEEKLKKEMELKKDEPRARLNTDPLYQNMLNQLNNIEFEIITLKERQKSIMEQGRLYQQRVENTPAREQQLLTLNRDYDNLKANYNSLLNRKLEAQLSENLEKRQKGERFRIVDPANLPQVPFWPTRSTILLMAIGAGIGAALGVALVLEFLIFGFKKPQEVEDAIGLPVFATIPNFSLFNENDWGFKGFIRTFYKRG